MTPAEQQIETKIASLGLTAPRIQPQRIDTLVASLTFDIHHIPGTTTILASAFLPSGFHVVTGSAAAVSPANFRYELGVEMATNKARDLAREKLWELEGYMLKETIHQLRTVNAAEALSEIRTVLEKRCGAVSGDASACACPGGPCSDAIDQGFGGI